MKRLFLVIFVLLFLVPSVHAEYEGTLIIESIGLYEPVSFIPLVNRNYDLTELNFGVARLDQTSWNDITWGRTVLVGHTPGAFENLTNVHIGDIILLMTDKYILEYIVYDITYVEAGADPRDWFTPTNAPTLLLQTCYGDEYRLMIEASLKNYYE